MADITHGTWIKDGKAVDAVFSDGRQVYGRNLIHDTSFKQGLWKSAFGNPKNQNMNNWILSDPAKKAASITYKNGVNTIDYTGVGDYEVFNMPIHAKVGDKVSVTFAYTQPAVLSLDGSSNGVPVSFLDHPAEHPAIGANPIYLGVNAQSRKVYTISTTATSKTMYLSFNFGYLQDGINWQFELSSPLGGATVTVEPFDSTTNIWHIVAKQGVGNVIGIYLYGYANDKLPDSSDWSYSADMKGTGKVVRFGIENGSRNPIVGAIGKEWSRISQTGHVDNSKVKTLVMYFDTTDSPLDVYIKLPKLETGTTATPYSIAPEDILN